MRDPLLRPMTIPPAHARPGHRKPALPRLWHYPARRTIARGLGTILGVRNALWAMLGLFALSGTVLLTRAQQ